LRNFVIRPKKVNRRKVNCEGKGKKNKKNNSVYRSDLGHRKMLYSNLGMTSLGYKLTNLSLSSHQD
jgi:hypothetical protein